MTRRRWTDEALLAAMVGYIRQYAALPTATEYTANRGDMPDESTIRTRLGGWTAAWQAALRVALAPDVEPADPQVPMHGIWQALKLATDEYTQQPVALARVSLSRGETALLVALLQYHQSEVPAEFADAYANLLAPLKENLEQEFDA